MFLTRLFGYNKTSKLKVLNLKFSRFSLSSQFFSSNATEKNSYDIIITGGGMVGSALAASIGHNNVLNDQKVLLLESGKETILKSASENYSSAVCALSHNTKELLTSFGAWRNLLRLQKVQHMRVWDSASDTGISFNLDDLPSSSSSSSFLSSLLPSTDLSALSELAYIVENNVILSAITNQLAQTDVEVRYNSKVKSYDLPNNNTHTGGLDEKLPTVELENGEKYTAKLLIGADGSNSLLRKTSNIKTIGWSYNQTAVVATVKLNEDRGNNTAWQRFLQTGPIALLPLSDDYSCLIWTTSREEGQRLLSLEPQAFVNHVNHAYCDDQHMSNVASKASHVLRDVLHSTGLGQSSTKMLPPTVTAVVEGSRKGFPLSLNHANHYVKDRIALIGDAAHRVHPLSGQGVNLGFGDVSTLVHALQEGVLRGADVGSLTTLAPYESSRQRRVVPMMASIDAFNRCYSNNFPPLILLRTLACQVADSVPSIKQKMIQFAVS